MDALAAHDARYLFIFEFTIYQTGCVAWLCQRGGAGQRFLEAAACSSTVFASAAFPRAGAGLPAASEAVAGEGAKALLIINRT